MTDLKERVAAVVAEVLPLLHVEGGGAEVVEVEDGVARVRLTGTCTSCPSVVQAVLFGLEDEVRKRLPEVAYLEAVP